MSGVRTTVVGRTGGGVLDVVVVGIGTVVFTVVGVVVLIVVVITGGVGTVVGTVVVVTIDVRCMVVVTTDVGTVVVVIIDVGTVDVGDFVEGEVTMISVRGGFVVAIVIIVIGVEA